MGAEVLSCLPLLVGILEKHKALSEQLGLVDSVAIQREGLRDWVPGFCPLEVWVLICI